MKTLIRLTSFFQPYKFILFISIIASILYGLFNVASLWIVGTLIGNLFGSVTLNNQSLSGLNGKINYFFSNLISSESQIIQLKMICIFLFITFLFKNIFYYINWVSISYIQLNIIKNLRNKFYSSIQKFSMKFFDKNKTGEILSIMLNDINWIKVAFNKSLQVLINELISIIILVYMLFLISPFLTLLILCTVPVSGLLILKISQSIKRKVKRASIKIADISSYAEDKMMQNYKSWMRSQGVLYNTKRQLKKAFDIFRFEGPKSLGLKMIRRILIILKSRFNLFKGRFLNQDIQDNYIFRKKRIEKFDEIFSKIESE